MIKFHTFTHCHCCYPATHQGQSLAAQIHHLLPASVCYNTLLNDTVKQWNTAPGGLDIGGSYNGLFCFQVLRFMGDPHLNGAQENMFGNYIIQRGLSSPGLQDEILAQVVNQVWRNVNYDNAERGWLLLLACVCSFAPSPKMDKYLLK